MQIYTTDQNIEDLVAAMRPESTDQQRHWFREALRGMVRLAKHEQLLQMKQDVNRAIGNAVARK